MAMASNIIRGRGFLNQATIFLTGYEWVHGRMGVAGSVSNLGVMRQSPLFAIQDKVRLDFGWDLEKDRFSIHSMLEELAAFKNPQWNEETRSEHLQQIQSKLQSAETVVIIGAAVEAIELESMLSEESVIIAADGAVGVFSELMDAEKGWSRLAAVVSDADGFPHLREAINRSHPIFLHAHGDNVNEWREMLKLCNQDSSPIVLTHQCPEVLEGAINPGGFTDGDRAIALALHLGVPKERISLCGFTTQRIGRWTGQTEPEKKMRKLNWMAKVIEYSGVEWGENHGL